MEKYYIVLCIFLLFHDLNVRALNTTSYGNFNRNKQNNGRYSRATNNKCAQWEEFDGKNCVCTSDKKERCTSEGGVVCDNYGNQYKSRCFAALQVCNKKDFDMSIKSCGACEMLRLTDGGIVPTDRNLIVFQRVDIGDKGIKTTYKAINHPQKPMVYFDENFDRWVIGKNTGGNDSIGMVQEMMSEYPQDNDGGMLVAKKNSTGTTFVLDSNLRLECYNATLHGIQKRFLFTLIFTIVSVAVAATATILKVVQSKRGCLYYPSVCTLRDEVKNQLQPEVKSLKDRFRREYGDPLVIKKAAEDIQDMVLDINEAITSIEKLHTSIDENMSKLTDLILDLSPIADIDVPKNSLAEYDQWKSSMEFGAALSVVFFEIDLAITLATLPSLLATTVSMVTVGLAAFTAVVAIGFAIVDIVSSVIEERKIRDKLRSAKSTLLRAKNDFNRAFTTMKNFQKTFCKTIIKYLKELADKGRQYHSVFSNLADRLHALYMNVPRSCDYEYFYSKSKASMLINLKAYYVKPLKDYLETKEDELKRTIAEVDKIKVFLEAVTFDIKKHKKHPQKIFEFAMTHQKQLTMKLFPNYFTFLRKIAVDLIPRVSCYWGISLQGIRTNTITAGNFRNAAVCKSSELFLTDSIIKIKVSQGIIPCSIFSRIKGPVFTSKTSVLRYIAQYTSPRATCYWGYDLKDLRSQPNGIITNYENAEISTAMYSTLSFIPEVNVAYGMMCSQYKICDRKWQNFILCSNPSSRKLLQCSSEETGTGTGCLPPKRKTQSC